MASKRIAVVTGGNKGVGLEICRQLAFSGGVLVVLTSRDEKKGEEAVEELKASGLSSSDVVFHQLDVKNPSSIASLTDFMKTEFGKLDILVNNAGVNGVIVDADSFWSLNLQPASEVADDQKDKKVAKQSYEKTEECLRTNYYGAKKVTEALLPLLLQSSSARIVNVSSKLGQLKNVTNEVSKKMLGDLEGLTEERIEEFVNEFLQDARDDNLEKNGWTDILSAYIVSKAALNAYSRILAKKFPSFRVNAVSPGFVKTDMSFHKGKHTVEEGARGPVMLALIQDDGSSGKFFIMMEESTF